jgi:hypothetical protein
MKKNSIKAKKHHGQTQGAPRQAAAPEQRSSLKRWGVLALALCLAGGSSWAFFEFVVWNKLPSELVGKWDVVEGPKEYKEATFEGNGRENLRND